MFFKKLLNDSTIGTICDAIHRRESNDFLLLHGGEYTKIAAGYKVGVAKFLIACNSPGFADALRKVLVYQITLKLETTSHRIL